MQRADDKLATSLMRLTGDHDFVVVKAWLEVSYIKQMETNIDLRGEEATRGQGYAEALKDITSLIRDPKTLADKFSRK